MVHDIEQHPGGPLTITVHTGNRGDWILENNTWNTHDEPAALPGWFSDCPPRPAEPTAAQKAKATGGGLEPCLARLTREGYRQHVVYQPQSRFWPLQWAETGLYLAASAVLTGCCLWWIRRRLS